MRVDALERHDLEDLLAQRLVALAGAVLQRLQAAGGDDALGQVTEDVERQALEERHAAGERDDLGPVGDGEQRADLARTRMPWVRSA